MKIPEKKTIIKILISLGLVLTVVSEYIFGTSGIYLNIILVIMWVTIICGII